MEIQSPNPSFAAHNYKVESHAAVEVTVVLAVLD